MFVSYRGVLAALVCLFVYTSTSEPARAAHVDLSPESRGGGVPRIYWDPALTNEFGWLIAGDRIPTACRDGRAAFPNGVAMMACEVRHAEAGRRSGSNAAAFFGGGGGGVAGSIGGSDIPAADPGVVTTPLPGGLALLLSGLGGLAIARRSRSRRLAD
jgi:hypothetical protein